MMKQKIMAAVMTAVMLVATAACGSSPGSVESEEKAASSATGGSTGNTAVSAEMEVSTGLPGVDAAAWKYNTEDDVYYQTGICYCETPADENYETLAVFVPGAYLTGTENGDGTYTCEISSEGNAGAYTASDAPIVMPVNTPGYSAQSPLTDYTSVTEYTEKGMVYVHAGCRGRDAGAPAGVTDLKAAVRYLRYVDEELPGDAESIFTFGMSGGGAQSSLMGTTGDNYFYEDYLHQIGAVDGVSDAVLGSMCWCPITGLDSADAAYEWMMGSTRSGLSDEEQQISDRLAASFAEYINRAGLKDPEGHVLMLDQSSEGIYQAGSYYDYMKTVIEESLNHFLSDTEFPYDASSASSGGGMPGGGRIPDGMKESFSGDGQKPDGNGEPSPGNGTEERMKSAESEKTEEQSYEEMDDITRNETDSGLTLTGTYDTVQDYIDALNQNGKWVEYDSDAETATITDIASFVKAFKQASKNLGAFDQLDAGQGENTLFGYGDGNGAHFDARLAEILKDLGSSYASAYAEDLEKTDALGSLVEMRLHMYTPLYYLLESQEGYQSSTVAKYWRIRSGIAQGDCALSTEMNLALALEQYQGVESVDFETVWGEGHTQAERTGSATENFIDWVNECMGD